VEPTTWTCGDSTAKELRAVVVCGGAVAAMPAALADVPRAYLLGMLILCYVVVMISVRTLCIVGIGAIGLLMTWLSGVIDFVLETEGGKAFLGMMVGDTSATTACSFTEVAGATAGSVPGPRLGLRTSPGYAWLPGTPLLPRPIG
jgi:hypothetical protein